jgi:hypothetical protein
MFNRILLSAFLERTAQNDPIPRVQIFEDENMLHSKSALPPRIVARV